MTFAVDQARQARSAREREEKAVEAPLKLLSPKAPRRVMAPDFTLYDLSGQAVTLSSFRGKRPVLLVFGNLGWDFFRNQLVYLQMMREVWAGQVEFLFIYVRDDSHRLDRAWPNGQSAALRAFDARGLPPLLIPPIAPETEFFWLLDTKDHEVENAYQAFPQRLILVGIDGNFVYDAGCGVNPPWDLQAIDFHLKASLRESPRSTSPEREVGELH